MSTKPITYKEEFEQLQNLFLSAYITFYVWKALQRKEYEEIYKVNDAFWSAVLPALENEWFINLARLYEDSNYSTKGLVISVYALILKHPDRKRAKEVKRLLNENSAVLKNINRIRDHHNAHNNVKFLINSEKYEKEIFPIQYGEIEDIFQLTDKILGLLHPNNGSSYILDHLKYEAEMHTKDLIESIQYFESQRKDYKKRWIKGEVPSPNFPPNKKF